MSTLRTYNVQSSDSASTNIQLTENGGIIVAGISTFSNNLIADGRIGIGTDNPAEKLEVYGNARFKDPDGSHGIEFYPDVAGLGYQRIISYNRTSSAYESLSIGVNNFIITQGSSTEIFRVNSDGNIGIGTDSPDVGVRLQIEDSSPVLRLNHTSSGITDILGSLQFGSPTDPNCAAIYALHDGSTTSGALSFRTEATGGNIEERVRISGIGSVGIGTDDPKQTLHVQDSSGRKIYPPPLFRARKNSADSQTLNNSTSTKITYTIEDVDTHGYYNTSNSRFTPTIPGWYFIEATVRCSQGTAGARFDMTLYIDGSSSVYASGQNQQNSNDMGTGIATLVYLDGTQYVEVYVNQNSGSACGVAFNSNAGGGNNINHFSAFLVSPD